MVSSRWVSGLSTGTRAFSASDTMVNATPATSMLGYIASSRCASVSTMVVSEVEPEIMEAQNSTISSAGSARKPTSISRRAPKLPKAVPTSIAANEIKTRASANKPTNAMASAAGDKGKSVDKVGMMALASNIQPKTI